MNHKTHLLSISCKHNKISKIQIFMSNVIEHLLIFTIILIQSINLKIKNHNFKKDNLDIISFYT